MDVNHPGDSIIEVNGVRHDVKAMLEKCKAAAFHWGVRRKCYELVIDLLKKV